MTNDFETISQSFQQEEQAHLRNLKAQARTDAERLLALGVKLVDIFYSGAENQNSINCIKLNSMNFTEDSTQSKQECSSEIYREARQQNWLDSFQRLALFFLPAGWETNYGGKGKVTFYLPTLKIGFNHYEYDLVSINLPVESLVEEVRK